MNPNTNSRLLRKLKETDLQKIRLNAEWLFLPGAPSEAWQTAPATGTPFRLAGNTVDLDTLAGGKPQLNAEATLYNEFTADKPGIAQLGIGCDWWFEAACNGVSCCSTFPGGNMEGTISPENHAFFLSVKKGRNQLTVRVRRGSAGWGFACGEVRFRKPVLPELRHGPWLGNPDAGKMSIRFVTSGEIGAGVEFRKPGEKSWSLQWDHLHGQILRREFHALHLEGLEEGVEYEYRPLLIDPRQPEKRIRGKKRRFRVPERKTKEFNFFYTADLQFPAKRREKVLGKLLKAAGAESCDFIVLGGDIADSFNREELFQHVIGPLCRKEGSARPVVMIRGNHELRGKEADRYLECFGDRHGRSYGVFRFGDTAFLMLDCWEDKPAGSKGADYCKYNLDELFLQAETEFLKEAMASEAWTSAKRRIVLAHGAPYSHFDGCLTMPFVLKKLTDPYFAGKNPAIPLNLWLAGHTHRYSRSIPGTAAIAAPPHPKKPQTDGKNYRYPVLTVAGPSRNQPYQASAFRVDASRGKLTVSAFAPNGQCFEKIEIADTGEITELISLPHHDFEK